MVIRIKRDHELKRRQCEDGGGGEGGVMVKKSVISYLNGPKQTAHVKKNSLNIYRNHVLTKHQ